MSDCTCGRIMLGSEDSGSRNWNPDCGEHGVDSAWYSDPAVVAKREAQRQRTIDLQMQAREARRKAQS